MNRLAIPLPIRQSKSLGTSLVFAILFHALLIAWLKLPKHDPIQMATLTVSLSPRVTPSPPIQMSPPSHVPEVASPKPTQRQVRLPVPLPADPAPQKNMPPDNTPVHTREPQQQMPHPPAPSVRIDLDQAAAIARLAGVESIHDPVSRAATQPESSGTLSMEQIISTAFAGKPRPRANNVTRDADGVIRVTTAYGTEVCYKPSELLGMSGLVEPYNIPMTCP